MNKYRENAFFLFLLFCVSVFPFSEALVSISIGLLLLQVFVLQSWKHPTVKWSSSKILLFPVSIFIVYLVGTFFTSDYFFAMYELKKTVFWLVVPLAVFLSPRISKKRTYLVLFVFIFSVTFASLIIAGKLALNNYIQISEFRSLSIISHIRFSLQVVLSIILIVWFIFNRNNIPYKINANLLLGFLVWLVLFLILLKSLLGLIAFFGVLLISLILVISATKSLKIKVLLSVLLVLVFLLPLIYVGAVFIDFYNFKEIKPEDVEYYTPSGNLYHHDFEQELRENGHLVYVYVCEDELRQEWNKRSEIKYDDNLNGYILGSTLIRYLTSKGYRKDSVGVSKLSPADIELIQNGVTNYKFKNHAVSIYPRIYETIWELEYYRQTGDPNEKTLAQRIEFAKASFIIIKENPLFGIGTGNWVLKYNEAYNLMDTQLDKGKRGPSHNQYFNYIVKFGVFGFVWILVALLFPVFKLGHRNNFIFILFLATYAIANLGDANMETHMGLSFFSFFYSFFLRNSTSQMKKPVTLR